MRYRIGGLIFGGAYTWRGLFSEFYGMLLQIAINATRYVKSASASGSADNNYLDLDYYEYLKTLIQYFFFKFSSKIREIS